MAWLTRQFECIRLNSLRYPPNIQGLTLRHRRTGPTAEPRVSHCVSRIGSTRCGCVAIIARPRPSSPRRPRTCTWDDASCMHACSRTPERFARRTHPPTHVKHGVKHSAINKRVTRARRPALLPLACIATVQAHTCSCCYKDRHQGSPACGQLKFNTGSQSTPPQSAGILDDAPRPK